MAPVHVAFCCDGAYVRPLAVAVRSLLETARNPERLRLWLVINTGSEPLLLPVLKMTRAFGASGTILPTSAIKPLLRDAPVRGHISLATYYRLFLPEILPSEVARLIYLDADVLVRRPIEDLWGIDLADNTIAAVLKPRAAEHRLVGVRSETDYFNSGVLVIDAVRWRREQVRQAALQFVFHHVHPHCGHDQPALNHVFDGRWKRLDLRWNQQFKFFVHTAGYLQIPRGELRRLRREPFIIHYTTSSKPWHYMNDHPLRDCYYAVLDRTPFAGWRPRPVSWRDRLLRPFTALAPHYLRPAVLRNVYRPHYRALRERLQLVLRRPAHG